MLTEPSRKASFSTLARMTVMTTTLVMMAVVVMACSGCRPLIMTSDEDWIDSQAMTSSQAVMSDQAVTSGQAVTSSQAVTLIQDITADLVGQQLMILGEAFNIERHDNGNITLECRDESGSITVFIPEAVGIDKLGLATGDAYRIRGIVQTYRNQVELVPDESGDVGMIMSENAFSAVQVVSVVDGDTLYVEYGDGRQAKVRMIGIDSPELARDGQTAEYYAEQARDYVTVMLLDQTVYLEQDYSDVDRYGRQLRYVWPDRPGLITEDAVQTLQFNSILLMKGYANFVVIGMDKKYADIYRDNEKQAQQDNLGMWAG